MYGGGLMSVPLPSLDDRTWQDLVDGGRAVIPRDAPDWTDHNVHDPGVTLIELAAWLTESAIYRVNQIPDQHRLKFLELIGYTPKPPSAARTFLSFSPDPGTTTFELPAGVEFETGVAAPSPPAPAGTLSGSGTPFRTLRTLSVADMLLRAVLVDSGNGLAVDHTDDIKDGLPLELLGTNPRPGATVYLGFQTMAPQVPTSIAFRLVGPGNDARERERIEREEVEQRRDCRPFAPDIRCPDVAPPPEHRALTLRHHSARLEWEVSSGTGADSWILLREVRGPERPAVGEVRDDTRSLTLDGTVEWNLPPTAAQTTLGGMTTPLFYVRCRLAEGEYDATPRLRAIAPNAVEAEQTVVAVQSFPIGAAVTPTGPIPSTGDVTRLRFDVDTQNVVQSLAFDPTDTTLPRVHVLDYQKTAGAPGTMTLDLVLADVGNGTPDQSVELPGAPVQVASLRIFTLAGSQCQEWLPRNDFDSSRRRDRHFTVDPTAGTIRFGDGERGRTPDASARMLAKYRTTAADLGNLDVDNPPRPLVTTRRESEWNGVATSALPAPVLLQLARIVTNFGPVAGGTAAEELEDTIARAAETLHAHERLSDLAEAMGQDTLDQIERAQVLALWAPERGVNVLDIERLALAVPGTRIARARAWPNHHPALGCLRAAGVVTVVIMPDADSDRPEPSQGLLAFVRRFLDRRRIVCTRLEVVGPTYVPVSVIASIQARTGASGPRVEQSIRDRLEAFFDARHGGPNGLGWPFGRSVYRSEILACIDGVPGVDHVLELRLETDAGEPSCGDVEICPTSLPASGAHRIAASSNGRIAIPVASRGLLPCPPDSPSEPEP